MYYRGAAAAIVVYDITSTSSFNRAKTWVKELQRQGSQDVVIALAGKSSFVLQSLIVYSSRESFFKLFFF